MNGIGMNGVGRTLFQSLVREFEQTWQFKGKV
jgi:hypothetical protein